MTVDKGVSNLSSDRVFVIPDIVESSSTGIVAESVKRSSKIIPQVKRMVQPLITPMVKNIKMTTNFAKTLMKV